jgi:simple sugar transport system permease protein
VIVALVVLAVFMYLAHLTRFGRTVYAMGGNEQSARLMGLAVGRTKVLVYTLGGFCSALAGLVFSNNLLSGHGLYANGLEMEAIAAVIIGGTLLTGGVGYVFGTMFGVLVNGLIQVLIIFNGELSSWWTRIVIGLLTLIFILVQSTFASWRRRQAGVRPARRRPTGAALPADGMAAADTTST